MGYGTTPFEANRNQEQEKFRKQTRQNIIFQEVDFPTTRVRRVRSNNTGARRDSSHPL